MHIYLVSVDLNIGQFMYVVRKRIKISAEKAIFIFIKNILQPSAASMSAIYDEHKDEDGFLYMTYSGESTFGRGCSPDAFRESAMEEKENVSSEVVPTATRIWLNLLGKMFFFSLLYMGKK